MNVVSRIAEMEQAKYRAVAMYIAFLYCALKRRGGATAVKRREITTLDELRKDALKDYEQMLRNSKARATNYMKKADLSLENSENTAMSGSAYVAMGKWERSCR